MVTKELDHSPAFKEELIALVESGLYDNEEAFLADAVRTFLAARPDLREAIAFKLYERGIFSLGKAAEWSGLTIEAMKESLYRWKVTREANETPAETESMADRALKTARRS